MRSIFIIFTLFASITAYAAKHAVTDTGEEVILKDDGTWHYVNQKDKQNSKIKNSNKIFKKPKESTFLLKSTRNNFAVWVNPKKWSFKKEKPNDQGIEYFLKLRAQDLYCMMINEAVQIPPESLVEAALANAKKAAPDAEVVDKEYRMVNGEKIIYMEMGGTLSGIKFIYRGYYTSNASGTTQLITYTAKNLVGKFKFNIDNLLNGLTHQ